MARDTTPFGTDLAARVAAGLRREPLAHSHRDYCGTGLFRTGDHFLYATVQEGYPDVTLREFSDEASFVEWLAAQSDKTLAGLDPADPFPIDNQVLDRARLLGFVR